ncbi:c-type cytochrome biogenesis protein CcmI [Cohaesibacter celericrescens]|uniref:C-type cytochrome biogenesis protein CcmI n=1 Tax=Cohaesibacter celericrescens TaxID=2067669 RepID=A0A2N5XR13_9HYPH|nr:c-type cytochrome biogenesis protein CcmI [Cohaesibacter celericrescens]PLW76944.1 c-type cytochrome biogenesis protein CcmI [Cohaesibacter celericrescens]
MLWPDLSESWTYMFWIIAAVLTAISVSVVIIPLTRKARANASADEYDLTIYKSQLKEIDGDVERGLIEEKEAEAARAEVARRMLNAQSVIDQEASEASSARDGKYKKSPKLTAGKISANTRIAVIIVLLVIPFVSAGLYFVLGSPSIQSQPLASRLQKAPEEQSLTELVASAELKLKQNPDDLQGWKKLAPIYLSMRRSDEAVQAFGNVVRLEGETVDNLANLGEAIVVREAGVVSKNAFSLFQRANQLDANAPKPRFFLAIALGQQGRERDAIDAWNALIQDSEAEAPWVPFAKNQISTLNKRLQNFDELESSETSQKSNELSPGSESGESSLGPSSEDIKAAAEMTSEDRMQMVEDMVSRLADRLNDEGGTADEWVKLIRAELVLNRPDMAVKTVTKALSALQSDVGGLEKVKAAARSLGVSINQ